MNRHARKVRVEVGKTDKLCMRQVKLRLAQQCRERYELLLAALQASRCPARPAATFPAASTPGVSLARPGPVSAPAPPALAALPAASQAPGNTSQAGPSSLPSLAGSAAGHEAGTTGLPAGGQAVASVAVQAPAPLQAGGVPAVAGPPHSAPGGAPQLGPVPYQAQPPQQAPGGAAAQQSGGRSLDASVQAGLPGQQKAEARSADGPRGQSQAWSLAAGLETVREHLAWLATSNIVCSPEVDQPLAPYCVLADLVLINVLFSSYCGFEVQAVLWVHCSLLYWSHLWAVGAFLLHFIVLSM